MDKNKLKAAQDKVHSIIKKCRLEASISITKDGIKVNFHKRGGEEHMPKDVIIYFQQEYPYFNAGTDWENRDTVASINEYISGVRESEYIIGHLSMRYGCRKGLLGIEFLTC